MQLWANRKQFEYRYHNHYDYDDAAHLLLLLTNANHCLLHSYYTNGVHSVYHQQYERVCLIDRWHLTKCTGIVHSLSVVNEPNSNWNTYSMCPTIRIYNLLASISKQIFWNLQILLYMHCVLVGLLLQPQTLSAT